MAQGADGGHRQRIAVADADLDATNGVVHEIGDILVPAAPIPAASCDAPSVLEGFGEFLGTNVGDAGENTRGSCGGGNPAVFAFRPDAETLGAEEGIVCLSTRGSALDTLLYIRTECANNQARSPVMTTSSVAFTGRTVGRFTWTAGQDYWVFDGFNGAQGEFNLTFSLGECGPPLNIMQTIARTGQHRTLVNLIDAAGLRDTPEVQRGLFSSHRPMRRLQHSPKETPRSFRHFRPMFNFCVRFYWNTSLKDRRPSKHSKLMQNGSVPKGAPSRLRSTNGPSTSIMPVF